MLLKLKDIQPNPFRDFKINPLDEAKIVALMSSINQTGFWENCVFRMKDGKPQLSGGHTRLEAAKRSGLTEADFILKDFTDAQMLQAMDSENREVYASSPAAVIESVKAVVTALAEGIIPPFNVDESTRKDTIRYAPSYVAGKEPARVGEHPYTASLIATFLGRTYSRERGTADTSVIAALNFLHLKELGAITSAVLVKDKQPISARKLFDITSDIKKRTEIVAERRGKTQTEIAELREKQLAAQKKAKEDEAKAEAEHKALMKKLADAQREEQNVKADALLAKLKKQQEDSRNIEERNKIARKALDDKLAQKKAWEAEQRVQDAYLPIRRDVEAMVSKLETTISERNPLREQVKSLANCKGLKEVDRVRLRKAVIAVADWFSDWVAPQFAPELKAAQKRAVDTRKTAQIRTKGSGA